MRFTTTVELGGRTATGFEVPAEVVEALGRGTQPAVTVTLPGHTYRSTVAARGGRFLLPLSAENREAAIAADAETEAAWQGLSHSRRRRIVLAVTGAKAAETHTRRIDRSVADLRAGRAWEHRGG